MTREVKIMTHFVAGFPGIAESREIARGLVEGGAAYLEIQFPFSDPSADGPDIQAACSDALDAGFRVTDGFELVASITAETSVPVFLMSYASIVFARGVEKFVEESRAAGVHGLIVPDLAVGCDEGLYEAASGSGVEVVPVIAPGITDERVREILAFRPVYLYAAIRSGITGSQTAIDDGVIGFLRRLEGFEVRILAGFGISHHEQIAALQPYVHSLVVGSEIVRTIRNSIAAATPLREAVMRRVRELVKGGTRRGEAQAVD